MGFGFRFGITLMTAVSLLFDGSVAGSLANASLCATEAKKASAPDLASTFDPAAPARACPIAAKTKWRRLADALLSPISGPTLEPPHSGAGRI